MKRNCIRLIGRLFALVLSICWAQHNALAAPPASQPSAQEMRVIVQKLDDKDPAISEAARVNLMTELLAVPAYEAALADPAAGPAARAALQHALDLLRPGYDARVRKLRLRERRIQWGAENGIDAYKAVGHHSGDWDDSAIAALQIGDDPLSREQIVNIASRTKISQLCDHAIADGCDDGRILYSKALAASLLYNIDHPAIVESMRAAAHALAESHYSPFIRADAAARVVDLKILLMGADSVKDSGEDLKFCQDALALMPEAAKEKDMIWPGYGSLAWTIHKDFAAVWGDEKRAFDTVFPVIEAALPGNSTPLWYKGLFYTEYCRAARPVDFTKATAEENKVFDERLTVARQALEQAWKLDPGDSRAPIQMLRVEIGQDHGHDDAMLWWKRAMAADPDNYAACEAMIGYLDPKQHGTAQQIVEFGRQCLQTENWHSEIPLMLVDAHERAAKSTEKPENYYKDPQVWKDIDQTFHNFDIARPTYDWAKSRYALAACKCGQLVAADKQFKLLGDKVISRYFGSDAAMEEWREKAAQAAKDAGIDNTP